MILKVKTNSQANYNTSFQAKKPNKILTIECYNGKKVIVDNDMFDKYLGKTKKINFLQNLKNVVFENFSGVGQKLQKFIKNK